MSHSDFDVVSGPAIPGRRILPPAILAIESVAPIRNGQSSQTISVAGAIVSGSPTADRATATISSQI